MLILGMLLMQHSLDIAIRGKTYSLSCPKGQEARLLHLADSINAHLNAIGRQVPHAGELMILVMGLLTLADKLADYEGDASVHTKNYDDMGMVAGHLEKMAMRVSKLAERFAS
jgi:cell division protein ZapA